MNIYIGIDPSINSTGVCVRTSSDNHDTVKFYIIKGSKLTKREKEAEMKYSGLLEYIVYDKEEANKNDTTYEAELKKTRNFIRITGIVGTIITSIIYKNRKCKDIDVHICQEAISYGSTLRTRSVFDLAGLNYIIRMAIISSSEINEVIKSYKIAPPSEIKKYGTGKGNASKDLVVSAFKTYYNIDIPKADDIADAFFMSMFSEI